MGFLDRLQAGAHPHAAEAQTAIGSPFEIWGQRDWAGVDIVGESFYTKSDSGAAWAGDASPDGVELMTPVRLVHNSLNKYDSNAIEVHGSTGLLGHLSRKNAVRYAPIIEGLQQQGLFATTAARIWGRDQKDWNTGKQVFFGNVRIDLPEPHMMVPHNQPPAEPHQLLPSGSVIRVSASKGSTDATLPYLCREAECWVYATLHEVVDQGPRSSKQLAEVRLDGRPVGRLTPKMSSDMLPTVQFLNGRGFLTAVRAVVRGNQLKSEVLLHAERASELSQGWMDAVPAAIKLPMPQTAEPVPDATASNAKESARLLQAGSPGVDQVRAAPLAGWYADPNGADRLRWWDGTVWTGHTAA